MHTEKDCNLNLDTVNAAVKDLGFNGNDGKLGRHLKKIDFDAVERMKAEGMTNAQIYKRLGIAKSTYYLKLKEYNQNL